MHGYATFPTAFAGAQPRQLFTITNDAVQHIQLGFSFMPLNVGVSPDCKIWAVNRFNVLIFSNDGKFLSYPAANGPPAATMPYLMGIAFAANGEAFVVDSADNRILVFSPAGNLVRTIISTSMSSGSFDLGHVAIDRKRELLFFTSRSEHRVHVLKLDGSFVRAFGSKGSSGFVNYVSGAPKREANDGQFDLPFGIAVNEVTGEVAVGDTKNERVQVLCVLYLFRLMSFAVLSP